MHFQWYPGHMTKAKRMMQVNLFLLYTSDAADERPSVALGCCANIKQKPTRRYHQDPGNHSCSCKTTV